MQYVTLDIDGQQTEICFVPASDMPQVIMAIFVGQKDQIRIDAAELLQRYRNMSIDEEILNHIVDQIWRQYDTDGCGFLNEEESYQFISMVLQLNETMLAKSL